MPKVVDHDERRALILDRCFELFAARGYGSVRMRQVAKETGISIGALYHYFPDKESIGRQLFEHMAARIAAEAQAELEPEMSGEERMKLLHAFIEERQDDLSRTMLLGLDHHRLYPDGRDATVGAMRSFKAILIGLMQLGPEEGDMLLSILCGALLRRVLDPEDSDLGTQLGSFQRS